jgi:hypothetical protein
MISIVALITIIQNRTTERAVVGIIDEVLFSCTLNAFFIAVASSTRIIDQSTKMTEVGGAVKEIVVVNALKTLEFIGLHQLLACAATLIEGITKHTLSNSRRNSFRVVIVRFAESAAEFG